MNPDEADEDEVMEIDPLVRQLGEAADRGNVVQLVTLLDVGVDIDSFDEDGWAPLHFACSRGHMSSIVVLLDRGANTELEDVNRETPIQHASRYGYLEVIELLHARGANIHHVNVGGESVLHMAAWYDHLPICEFLLNKGVDLMVATFDGCTALSHYGYNADSLPSSETTALRCAALEAVWAAGPHPSQVRRRRWESRGPLLWVLAEHAYRPLQLRAQAIAAAAVGAPLPVVQYSPKEDVFRSEGLVRYIVAFL